tara:strand:- start:547 stop:798 length:252 start_codon:yes stop_codon:yes gene_type:complete
MKSFFITVLIHTTMVPDTGWLQWTQSYETKKECQQVVWNDFSVIHHAVKSFMSNKLIGIMEIRCMTYGQALKLNSDLGHKTTE